MRFGDGARGVNPDWAWCVLDLLGWAFGPAGSRRQEVLQQSVAWGRASVAVLRFLHLFVGLAVACLGMQLMHAGRREQAQRHSSM